jgi:hypothetical protein
MMERDLPPMVAAPSRFWLLPLVLWLAWGASFVGSVIYWNGQAADKLSANARSEIRVCGLR